MSHCYRIVYCSKINPILDQDQVTASILSILSTSRLNNARDAITGALLFGGTCFAQVLEGEFEPVVAAMDRITADPRHTKVTVLQMRAITQRSFPRWSMTYAGIDRADDALAGELLIAILDRVPADAARLYGLLERLAAEGERWIEPVASPPVARGFTGPAAAV